MNRVLRSTYNEILSRINSRATSASRAERSSISFGEIIADIENSANKTNNDNNLKTTALDSSSEKTPPVAVEVLSNLKAEETREDQNQVVTQGIPQPSLPINPVSNGVKSPAVPVKITSASFAQSDELKPEVLSTSQLDVTPVKLVNPEVAAKAFSSAASLILKKEDTGGNFGLQGIIREAGKFHGLDPNLALAVAKAESSFNPKAVSSDGFFSKGLFQLLDSTARDMVKRLGVDSKYQPFDPTMNSHLGVGYLRYLHDAFSTSTDLGSLKTHPAKSAADLENFAVAAFNVGEGSVAEAQAKASARGKDPGLFSSVKSFLPASTRDYVTRVGSYRKDFDANNVG